MPTTTIDLQVFDFKETPVRVVERDGQPWFCAVDVCRVLGIARTDRAVSRLHEDEKGAHTMSTLGGEQKLTCVSESGLYALIFTSRKPIAQEFRRWVTGEVLPAIRKTGRFEMKGAIQNGEKALPEIDPESEWANAINFIEFGPPVLRGWSISRKMWFTLRVHYFLRGLRVERRSEFDQRLGARVIIAPAGLLHYVAQQMVRHDRALLSNGSTEEDDSDFAELVSVLGEALEVGEKREYSFPRVFEVAKGAGLFGLRENDVLDQKLRCVLGKRIAAGAGRRYGDIIFSAAGGYRMRRYVVKRVGGGSTNGAEMDMEAAQ